MRARTKSINVDQRKSIIDGPLSREQSCPSMMVTYVNPAHAVSITRRNSSSRPA